MQPGRGYQAIMGWLASIQTAVTTNFVGWAEECISSVYNFFAPIGQFLADAVGNGVRFWNEQVLPATGQFVQGFLDWVIAIPENLSKVFDVLVD